MKKETKQVLEVALKKDFYDNQQLWNFKERQEIYNAMLDLELDELAKSVIHDL